MIKRLLLQITLLAFLGANAIAQLATTTSLVGNVVDASGKSIPNAKVTAVEIRTLATLNTITNDQGYYSFEFIPPGEYNVTVEQPGFQRMVKDRDSGEQ